MPSAHWLRQQSIPPKAVTVTALCVSLCMEGIRGERNGPAAELPQLSCTLDPGALRPHLGPAAPSHPRCLLSKCALREPAHTSSPPHAGEPTPKKGTETEPAGMKAPSQMVWEPQESSRSQGILSSCAFGQNSSSEKLDSSKFPVTEVS